MLLRTRYDLFVFLSVGAFLLRLALHRFSPELLALPGPWTHSLTVLFAPFVIFWIWCFRAVRQRAAEARRRWWYAALILIPIVAMPVSYWRHIRPCLQPKPESAPGVAST